jgi:hypothetical protein
MGINAICEFGIRDEDVTRITRRAANAQRHTLIAIVPERQCKLGRMRMQRWRNARKPISHFQFFVEMTEVTRHCCCSLLSSQYQLLELESKMDNTDNKNKWKLYRQELVQSFRDLPNVHADWTIPFVPWCGEEYWDTEPRILFVGKSVGAFNDADAVGWTTSLKSWQKKDDPDAVRLTDKYMEQRVASFQPASPEFWMIPLLIKGAFVAPNLAPEKLAGALAWSNLYKLNNSRCSNGIPSKQDLNCRCHAEFCLIHSCLQWLRREIEILQPDFVLLGIAHEWETIAKALSLPLNGYKSRFPLKLNDSQVEELTPGWRPKAVWVTYHFSSWNRNCDHGRLVLDMRQALSV